ncbi:sensor histidine kinase [Kaistella sp. G5-32]|uniref:histidine kinase n=1 Tax=Kaistella gelatinilytica TaxID=2787636 RepID=A0ABS0F8K7_9FLAO|nr:sensor histidine kinase [Kaistella gelatinilytica]MBF8456028.1 sensor histidine kinase [Kaistella gelatinilytica]
MEVFVWNMAISFQLLFIIVSGVIFIYISSKSFKYYALYNICLVIYLLGRNDDYYNQFQGWIAYLIGTEHAVVFTDIFNFFIQVVFYNFYSFFALYFLDLDKRKKFFKRVRWIFKFLGVLFLFFAVLTYFMGDADLYISLYTFIYLPVLLTIFILSVVKAMKYSGKHKYFFLVGVCSFVICALTAFAGTFVPALNLTNPILFFFVGIIIETIFFSLGLAFKIKLMNDEKNRIRAVVTRHNHQQEISKIQGLLEGEEKERKRIAEELHDGIAGDLSAIKLNLTYLETENSNPNNDDVLQNLSKIIDKSCQQIREISHNLSPSSLTNYGLVGAVDNFCKKVADLYKIKVIFKFSDKEIELTDTIETHIYRIVQELLNNVVKHSEAKVAHVTITYDHPFIEISVKDDGKGFTINSLSKGIGLSNIDSRIRFMNAHVKKQSTEKGSTFTIVINLNDIPKT